MKRHPTQALAGYTADIGFSVRKLRCLEAQRCVCAVHRAVR